MRNYLRKFLCSIVMTFLFLVLLPMMSSATPFNYTFLGSWDFATFSSSFGDSGDAYQVDFLFDNGGVDSISETFTQSDFISATVTVSATSFQHTFDYSDPITFLSNFTTNATGQLDSGWVIINDPITFYQFNFNPNTIIQLSSASSGLFSLDYTPPPLSSPGVAGSTVPEPSTMMLIGLGLLSFAGVFRRKSLK